MNSSTDFPIWDDLVVSGDQAIETDFGALPLDELVEAPPPRFGGKDLIEGEFGVPLVAAEFVRCVELFRSFFEREPAQYRLCRIVTSADSIRIDADKVNSFIRFTLSTTPINFVSKTPLLHIVSFDDLDAASKAVRATCAMKVSGEKIHFYADDRFERPLLTHPLNRFVHHCDVVADRASLLPFKPIDRDVLLGALVHLNRVLSKPGETESTVDFCDGIARTAGIAICEVHRREFNTLDFAFRPIFLRTLAFTLRFLNDAVYTITDQHAVFKNQTLTYGFERSDKRVPAYKLSKTSNLVRISRPQLNALLSSAARAFTGAGTIRFSNNDDSSTICDLTAFIAQTPNVRTIAMKAAASFDAPEPFQFNVTAATLLKILREETSANVDIRVHDGHKYISIDLGESDTGARYILGLGGLH